MKKAYYFLLILMFVIAANPSYAGEVATFESFYTESSGLGLSDIVIAALFALIVGGVIFFTGGTASPIVLSIGTFVGNLMGYSGVVATNAGLALLGGGAIAAGGFGMTGGAAVITAALTFGKEIVFDYTLNQVITAYSQAQFIEQSKEMLALPLPRNTDGSDIYEDAIEILELIDNDSSYSNPYNQKIIENTIQYIKTNRSNLSHKESLQLDTLLSLLYLNHHEYSKAKQYASLAIKRARAEEIKRTLPALIYAVSGLYEEKVDISHLTQNFFNYAILAEPDNALIPLAFVVYLDKIMYRFNDGLSKESHLRELVKIASKEEVQEHAIATLTLILVRYFTRLKMEQQIILSLSQAQNMTIKNSSKTLKQVKNALSAYNELLEGSSFLLKKLNSIDMSEEEAEKRDEFWHLYRQYKGEQTRLQSFVNDLNSYQNSWLIIYLILFLILIVTVVIFFIKKGIKKGT
ncbi:MAG: hypothetical protein VSS75_000075 [Candidatus Parabeggiatoa sp.]|nr:hypothetical protein [Candidatus Parabeggiatoa sp.]